MPDTLTAAPPAREPEQLRAAATARPRDYAHELAGRLLAARLDGGTSQLLAALADVTPDGNGAGNDMAALGEQAMGQLWSGSEYELKYLPLVAGGKLTGVEASGWAWTVAPEVDDYAGNKTAIPTNAATLEMRRVRAERVAGGHDLDRIYRDLGSPELMVSYWARMTESVRRKYDARALAAILAVAGTPIAPASGSAMEARIRTAFAVDTVARPTFTLVSNDLVLADALTKAIDAPVGPSFTLPAVTPAPDLDAATVVTGARGAVQVLTVTPPIRIEAVNIPNGGIDAALFGYAAALPHNDEAVVSTTVTPAPATAGARSHRRSGE